MEWGSAGWGQEVRLGGGGGGKSGVGKATGTRSELEVGTRKILWVVLGKEDSRIGEVVEDIIFLMLINSVLENIDFKLMGIHEKGEHSQKRQRGLPVG